jgi:hypothetical protein
LNRIQKLRRVGNNLSVQCETCVSLPYGF